AAARHASDDVNFVEQTDFVALRSDDFSAPKKFQDAIRECCGTRATARKCEDDQVFLVPEILLARLIPISGARFGLGDLRIDRTGGAAAQHEQQGEHWKWNA